jgi:rare lipoprotein A
VVQNAASSLAVPLRLPESVSQVYANPGSLFIDAGSFGRQDYASILSNRLSYLGARLTTSYTAPRERAYRIRIGPFATVPEAEAMLERTISAGVNDAAIVVE